MARRKEVSRNESFGEYTVPCPTCAGTGKMNARPKWNSDAKLVEDDIRDCVTCYGHKYITPLCWRCGETIASIYGKPFCPRCNDWPKEAKEIER